MVISGNNGDKISNMLVWDIAEIVNVIISSVIVLGLSYFAAWSYEKLVNRRKQNELREQYLQYESFFDSFDYQQWEISNGKILDTPTDTVMRIKYRDGRTFDVEIKFNDTNTSGILVFDDSSRGQLYFFNTSGTIDFSYRYFVYSPWVEHKLMYYTGIFIDASDKSTKFIMLRHRNWPH